MGREGERMSVCTCLCGERGEEVLVQCRQCLGIKYSQIVE